MSFVAIGALVVLVWAVPLVAAAWLLVKFIREERRS